MAGKQINMRLEITYDYHPTQRHRREHWMYVHVTGKTHEECKEKALKYFNKQMRDLGWTKKTTLTNIGPLRGAHDAAPHKTADPDTSAPASKSGDGNSKRPKRNRTGDTRNTRTSKRRVRKSKSA